MTTIIEQPAARSSAPMSTGGRAAAFIETVAIWIVFAIHAGWPPPEVNEPHYLAKARHFWDAGWIPQDFFLDSADAHLVFYVACGWLAKLFAFETASWIGRGATWLLMAIGWRRLSSAVVPARGWSILSAMLLVTLNERMHMAGEWFVGGFEAKSIAYALVFCALGEIVRQRWRSGLLLLGAATAFHVLVGGWSLLIVAGIWMWGFPGRPTLRRIFPAAVGAGVLAAIGCAPALLMNADVDPEISAEASRIYVFERLPHHLWAPQIALHLKERFALLVCVWFILCAFVSADSDAQRSIRRFVNAALLIVIAGLLLSLTLPVWPNLAAFVLRYYWFRLADVAVPLGVSLVLTSYLAMVANAWRSARSARAPENHAAPVALAPGSRVLLVAVLVAATCHMGLMLATRVSPLPPRADSLNNKVLDHDDWVAACRWLREHSPRDARALTPRLNQTFKWYAERSEVVTWKDVPQNDADLVRWRERLHDVFATGQQTAEDVWFDSLAERGESELRRLGEKYDAQYVVVEADPPLALERVYGNNSYVIYRISPR